MSLESLAALQELNELLLKCFLTIDLKSKSATLLVSENLPGSQPIVFGVRAVMGLGQLTPYLPTIPVSPH